MIQIYQFRAVQPICLGGLVSYFAQFGDAKVTCTEAYWYASGIVLSTAYFLTNHPLLFHEMNVACRIRVACSAMIYQKILRLTKSTAEESQNGEIINLLTNDLYRFELAIQFLQDIWRGPTQSIVYLVLIYMEIGAAGLIGVAFLLSFFPMQGK